VKLHVHSAALRELEQAVTHYEEERPGLGLELLDAVEETVAFAAENPAYASRRPAYWRERLK